MKERPILFSAPMVRAILENRKTMTRRIVKPHPKEIYSDGNWYPDRYNYSEWWCFWGKKGTDVFNKCGLPQFKCPHGNDGDRLWVRETFYAENREIIHYRADGWQYEVDPSSGWKPSMFMPRWASRIILEITKVKVERLQDISEEDAIKEGSQIPVAELAKTCRQAVWTERQQFAGIWNSINKKYPWESNPWVWVISFKRI